jgi:NADH:ubiquinone reductase (non-electrogenic)
MILVRVIHVLAFMAVATTAFVGVSRPSRPAIHPICDLTLPHTRALGETVLTLRSFSKTYDDCDVAIMGGGFGGLYTALAISREAKKKGKNVDVALVDPSDRFVFLPLLYDLTMGTASEGEVCPTYKELLEGTGVRYIKASFDRFSNDTDDKVISEAVLTSVTKPRYGKEKEGSNESETNLSFRALVVAVGATPQSILALVPGAEEFAQPFYTKDDAYATRELLFRMEQKIRQGEIPSIAVVGGGYGGVELAACVARRLPEACVTLMSRGPPMAGTRAEPLVGQALKKLGVHCETNSVDGIDKTGNNRFTVRRTGLGESDGDSHLEEDAKDNDQFDAVLWTAGSGPAYPVANNLVGDLALSPSGRLRVDNTLRCSFDDDDSDDGAPTSKTLPSVWALGDCSEIIPAVEPAIPKTAQAAMQQADVVASNVLSKISNREESATFEFQDLGSMLSLGGPNAAILGPKEDSQIASLLIPLLDTARVGLGVADAIFAGIANSPQVDKTGDLAPVVETLGLSLGGYGLGIDPQTTPGTISGTLSGAGRRAIYALRMPTNKQRAYAGASAFLSSAAALAKEASDQIERKNGGGEKRR